MFGSPVYPAKTLQFAINFPEDPSNRINEAGYKDSETPFNGWCSQLDGLWNGGTSANLSRPGTQAISGNSFCR